MDMQENVKVMMDKVAVLKKSSGKVYDAQL